jgi:hypothetical protein
VKIDCITLESTNPLELIPTLAYNISTILATQHSISILAEYGLSRPRRPALG